MTDLINNSQSIESQIDYRSIRAAVYFEMSNWDGKRRVFGNSKFIMFSSSDALIDITFVETQQDFSHSLVFIK